MAKRIKASLSITLLIYAFLSILLFDPKLFTGGDNAVYIALAESIASGKGYKNIYLPEEPPHTQYPPGFPLLLAIFIAIFGKNILILKFVIFLTGVGAIIFMYNIANKIFKENSSWYLFFYISIPALVIYNHWILSEIPFLFFSLGSIYFFILSQENKKFWLFILSSIFAITTFFIRTAGISLIAGFILYLFFNKKYKYLIIFLILFLLFFIPWEIRNSSVSTSGGYLDQLLAKDPYQMELGRIGFIEILQRIWENFIFYTFTIIPATLLPVLKAEIMLILTGIILLFFVIAGIIKRIKNFTLIDVYFLMSVIVLFIWPKVWSSDRFFLPIIPVFIIYVFTGLHWLQNKLKSKYFLPAIIGISIFLNIFNIIPQVKITLANNIAYIKGNHYAGYPVDWQNYFRVIEWLGKNIPEDKIIMARKPEFVYLLSGRKSFCYPFTSDIEKINSAIQKADYIILDSFYWTGTTYRFLLPVLQKTQEKFDVVHKTKNPEFFLLKVLD